MASCLSESEIWKQIDISESYLVCCMFEEAASLSASAVKEIRTTSLSKELDSAELAEMMESAGMVFVQSLKELGRTRELFGELKMLFGMVAAIPVQVFLAGACMQISEGYSSNLGTIFEEFLEKWVYLKDELNVLPKPELERPSFECQWQPAIPVNKYLEVADVYAITVLGMVLHKPDVAISWTERAGLPEEKRQDMLRRLHSLHLAACSSSPRGTGATSTAEGSGGPSVHGTVSPLSTARKFAKATELKICPNGDRQDPAYLKSIRPSIEHISNRRFLLKFGNFQLVLPRGKIMFISSLMLLACYILRKRHAALRRSVSRQVASVRKALVDAWQLAFSVQVNPLAAVQQLPSTTPRGSR